jgi:hypothetical protein
MAFPDPLALKNSGAAAKTFTRRKTLPNGAVYVSTDSSTNITDMVTITSSVSPKKGETDAMMRNLVRLNRSKVDADGIVHKCELSIQLSRAIDPDIIDADVTETYAWLNEFLIAASGDYKTRFNRGET